jgi:hypothetical protein
MDFERITLIIINMNMLITLMTNPRKSCLLKLAYPPHFHRITMSPFQSCGAPLSLSSPAALFNSGLIIVADEGVRTYIVNHSYTD